MVDVTGNPNLAAAAMETTRSSAAIAHAAPRRGRDRLLDPVNFALLPSLLLLLVARHFGMIAAVPTWEIVAALVTAFAGGVLFATRFPPGTAASKPCAFLALTTFMGGLLLYTIGWGAVLAVTFIASAAVVIEADGARYGRTAIALTLVTIAVGEIGVALGVFQSMVAEPTGHGLAVFEATLTATVIALLARGQRDKELAEEQQEQAEERFRALVQHTSDAILIIEDGGVVRYASPAVEHLFGCPPEALKCLDITLGRRRSRRSHRGAVPLAPGPPGRGRGRRGADPPGRRIVDVGRDPPHQPEGQPVGARVRVQHARHRRPAHRAHAARAGRADRPPDPPREPAPVPRAPRPSRGTRSPRPRS